jgi:hypothetical protein
VAENDPPTTEGQAPRPLFRALASLSAADLLATLRAAAVLSAAELGIRTVPISRLSGWFGVPLDLEAGAGPPTDTGEALAGRRQLWAQMSPGEQRYVEAVTRVLRRWPFGDGRCLRRSLALGHGLRRRGTVMRIGVARQDGDVEAHAWIEVGGVSVGDDPRFAAFGAER